MAEGPKMADNQTGRTTGFLPGSLSASNLAGWIMAFTPLILLIATWDSDGRLSQQALALRHYSFPVIAIEAFIVYAAWRNGFQPVAAFQRLPLFCRLLLFIWAAMAMWSALAFADDRAATLFVTLRYAGHILFFGALIHLAQQCDDTQSWLKAMTLGGLGYVIGLTLFAVTVPDPSHFPWVPRMPSATNIRQIGYFVAILAVAPLSLVLFEPRLRTNAAIVLTVMTAFIAWSGSRGALAGVVAASVFSVAILWKQANRRGMIVAATTLICGIGASLFFPTPSPEFGLVRMAQSVSQNDFSTGRTQIWKDTIAEIKLSPIVGHGAGRFNKNMHEKYGFDYNHPHQGILQFVYDWGIIGGIGAFALLIYLLWTSIRSALQDPVASRAFAGIAGLSTLGAVSMIDGPLFYPLSIVLALSLAAPLIAMRDRHELAS